MQGILAVLPKIVYAIYPTYSIFVGIIYHLTFAFLILKGRDGQAMVEGLYDLNLTPNVLRLTDFVKKIGNGQIVFIFFYYPSQEHSRIVKTMRG